MNSTAEMKRCPRTFARRSILLGVASALIFCPAAALAFDPFVITSPTAGSSYFLGQDVAVSWTGGDPSWDMTVYLIDINANQVADGISYTANDGAYTFALPTTHPIPGADVRNYRFYVENSQRTQWAYGQAFTVAVVPGFVITSPAAGSSFFLGQDVTVRWTGGDPSWNVNVQLGDVDAGRIVAEIRSTGNDGELTFRLPLTHPIAGADTRPYLFYVENVQRTQWIYGEAFTVAPVPAPAIVVTFPTEGAILTLGQPVTITWTGGIPGENVRITLVDWYPGHVNITDPTSSTENDGAFAWTLPLTVPGGPDGVEYRFYVENVVHRNEYHHYGPGFSLRTANTAPTAVAGPDQSIRAGATVHLDGSASFDDNTNPELLHYTWSFDSRPSGSTATFNDATSWMPTFVADKVGTYVVRLVVTDDAPTPLSSAPDYVVISTANLAPTAVATVDYSLAIIGHAVHFDGSGSTDPEHDPLTYDWMITAKPAYSTAALVGAHTATPTLTPDLEGRYEVMLVVSDLLGPGLPPAFIEVTAMTVAGYADFQILGACDRVDALTSAQVTTKGNQRAFCNFLAEAMQNIQKGKVSQAIAKLNQAIERTDGCALRGTPDRNGKGMDWITDCNAQHDIYQMLTAAVNALQY